MSTIFIKALAGILIIGVILQLNSFAQTRCNNCEYDSLVRQVSQKISDDEKIKLLAHLIDLRPSLGPTLGLEQLQKNISYINQLVQLNSYSKIIDTAPYEKLREGLFYWDKGNLTAALSALKQAINLFDKEKKVIPELLFSLRYLYNTLNLQEDRYHYYNQKLEHYRQNGPIENTAPCYHGIAGYYLVKADYNRAINNYLKAGEVYKKFNIGIFYDELSIIADLYALWGNLNRAEFYAKQVLALPDTSFNYSKVSSLRTLSYVNRKRKNFSLAVQYLDESLQMKNIRNEPLRLVFPLLEKSLLYLDMNQPDKAFPLMVKVKNISDSLKIPLVGTLGELETDFAFYRYYKNFDKNELAEKYILTAYKKAVEAKSNNLQLKYLQELGDFYEEENKPATSQQFYKRFILFSDSLQNEQNRNNIAQYEIDRKNEEQTAKISHKNMILKISAGVIVVVTILLIFIFKQLQLNKKILRTLKSTQEQLVFSEKMASLGNVTAGIAHEIQNPLNFVINFSEVNKDLVNEVQHELKNGNVKEASTILMELQENEQKITHHSKRADIIVKGMLQHSRSGIETKQLTDINALAEEYLQISYQEQIAKHKDFSANLVMAFDPGLDKLEVVTQEIARVFLNIYNNAFYSIHQKKNKLNGSYNPEVKVSTKNAYGKVEIKVRDNGSGIPEKVKNKIFQPFFTTKPPGHGVGLGLSLSYDIITKRHGGKLKVETKEGEFTEMIISLPRILNTSTKS
ncbi:MAG: ATP-binding protein [Bacteroidota bacterium]|nr:ATP-binding protein [Bacteroidota bacterium]